MKTLVTGATGFIGSHIVAALLARGDHVRGLVRDVERARDLRDQGVELVQGDITDLADCAAPWRERVCLPYGCAGGRLARSERVAPGQRRGDARDG